MIKGIVAFNFYSPPSLIPCQRRLILFARKTMWFPRKKIIWYPPPPKKILRYSLPLKKKIFRQRPPPQAISNEWSLPKIADIDIKINCFKVYMPRCNFMRLTKNRRFVSRSNNATFFFFFISLWTCPPKLSLSGSPMQKKSPTSRFFITDSVEISHLQWKGMINILTINILYKVLFHLGSLSQILSLHLKVVLFKHFIVGGIEKSDSEGYNLRVFAKIVPLSNLKDRL